MQILNKNTVNKKELPVKIIQFGEGNFLRAFVDWMIDKANDAGVMSHGIVAVQPIQQGAKVKNIFKQQDSLYHVYLEGIKDKKPIKETSLVKCLNDVINPYSEYEAYEDLFLNENIEIVISNTTEAGIRYEEGDDVFAKPPKSFPAKITSLLYQRYKKFQGDNSKGLHFICCELIENNGSTLLNYVLQHARYHKLEDNFLQWINSACYFYDTLVDRIVPGFPKEDIDEVKQELGFDDNLVVKGEYFHVWAIGGNPIIKDILPLDKIGLNVLFMDDIRDFRAKKVRILNGSHTAMVPVALQLGCSTVMDAFGIPLVEKYINKMVYEEVLPVINENPEELKLFASKILERFYNPFLKHYLKDISLNSLSKWETRNYPTLIDNYTKLNNQAQFTIFSLASLLVLYSGRSSVDFLPSDNTDFIDIIQGSFDRNNLRQWVENILTNKQIWKENISEIPFLIDQVTENVNAILEHGMEKALQNLI